MTGTTKVLVVDDQFLIRAGLVGLLRAAPGVDVVGEAGDGEEAVALAARTRPDVILMDIRMPGMSGIVATERILAEAAEPAPRILVLTTFDLDEYVYGALRAGASGFLLKDSGPERLLAAVAAVGSGDSLFAPSVTRRLVEAFARQAGGGAGAGARPAPTGGRGAGSAVGARSGRRAERPVELDALTGREVEVLRLTGGGLSNAEIAEQLFISEATVKTHLNRTMTKLDLDSRAQAVVVAYESGLVTPGGS
ncbi:response regulator transcription factor [Streptomyces sp. XD-27]|uniref:response regulator transcription factor n=1 Tax=Streptomyces sp. XD-27 TaxID=3062779 RepID=UPI0026F461F3|nr:response regulator transcription factor [Streptomyces sp. XD-27]WKX69243.1 response regulator transcription factor [Streptomyces sp. XD-27]